MVDKRCEHCENCFAHVETVYCTGPVKVCNKRHVPTLLTCAKCKEVRYCSRACQKQQWQEHKSPCDSHQRILLALALLGPKVERTFKAFTKFCQAISGYMEVPAISALELKKGKHRIDNHVFMLKIRAKETIFKKSERVTKGCITFRVESAECRTMKEMHELLDWRSGPLATPEITDQTLAHRPGLLRLFVLDTSGLLPIPLDGYTLPTDISNWPSNYHKRYDPNWRSKFFDSIGQPMDGRSSTVSPHMFSPSEYIVDYADSDEPAVPPARPSSPVEQVDSEEYSAEAC